MDGKVTVALIAAVVTAAGWLITHLLQQQRERQKKATEARAEYIRRQIEELYGPLANIATQIVIVNHVMHHVSGSLPQGSPPISDIFYFEYFQPLHQEARNLLKSKLHLVEGSGLPNSFYDYLTHSIQEEVQKQLWTKHQISTTAPGRQYPDSFTAEVWKTLRQLLRTYDDLLAGLHLSAPPSLPADR